MNGPSAVLDSAGRETRKPAAVLLPARTRWQPSAEFLLTLALIVDAVVIFAACALNQV
jgi:hypothetical protein